MKAATLDRTRENFKELGVSPRSTAMHSVVRERVEVGHLSDRQPPAQRSWRFALGLTAMALALVVGLYQVWKWLPFEAAMAADHVGAQPKIVNVDRPTRNVTTNVVLPATLRPWQTTTLHARVSGYLKAWHRDIGSLVEAGDLLAEIETPELDQELAQGEALAREAVAATVQAKAERAEARADLKVAESQLVRTLAEAELARSQLVRREKLLAGRAIAQEEYDTFSKEVAARNADVSAAKSDILRRRTNLETRAAIIEVREATAGSRQSNVERLKELQRFKLIVAPFSGTVTRRTAEVGMLVTAGVESLFTLEDMSRVRVQINVPQTYAVQTTPGVAVVVSLPESTAEPTEGTITRVTASVDSSSRTMLAEIELENSSLRFQPGSYAQATLSAPQGTSGWTIPTSTLSMRVDGPHVAIVNEQNRIELKAVSLGRNLGDRVVAAGLRGDERLVINPGDQLQSGVEVQIGSRSGGRNKDGISGQPQIGRPGGTTTSRPQLGAKG